MVKRYTLAGGREDVAAYVFNSDDRGQYVDYADYAALQAALEEALQGWAGAWEGRAQPDGEKRITELRDKFLASPML